MKINDIRAAVKCLEYHKDIVIDLERVKISFVAMEDCIGMLSIKVGKDFYPLNTYKKDILAMESVNNLEEDISYLEYY